MVSENCGAEKAGRYGVGGGPAEWGIGFYVNQDGNAVLVNNITVRITGTPRFKRHRIFWRGRRFNLRLYDATAFTTSYERAPSPIGPSWVIQTANCPA